MELGSRRAVHAVVGEEHEADKGDEGVDARVDLALRTLIAILYNFVPCSGHPGGSVSMSRILAGLLLDAMAYDIANPAGRGQDELVLAAGHKAMGLYAMLALRDESVRIACPDLLPGEDRLRLRLEDLLGFRRNPCQDTPLLRSFSCKALDGHPTPATPFVRLATGPSGCGVTSAVGLALAMLDVYGQDAPRVHVIEGEGGATPGRVAEALAAASACQLRNLVLHLDWNQSTIDVDRCCRSDGVPGDYVQWDPVELAYLHDFNTILVRDGSSPAQVRRAQAMAVDAPNHQPTAVIYRTVKGRGYGIEGRRSHGAGHAFCSEAFYSVLGPFETAFGLAFPRFGGEATEESIEQGYWDVLATVRAALEAEESTARHVAHRVRASRQVLVGLGRRPRAGAPDAGRFYASAAVHAGTPRELVLEPGARTTLRGQLGRCLGYVNRLTGGGVMGAAADLLDSTSVSALADGVAEGFFRLATNPSGRLVSAGGICEDAMAGIMSGLSAFGAHVGVCSSYAAFMAPLSHIQARCHAIGQEAKRHVVEEPSHPVVIVMGHAGPKTGEDGPTHADPQALQLYQENFVDGLAMTLTPWEPAEVWPLLRAALLARPAVVAVYVTRPEEIVPDRRALGIPPADAAAQGVYAARKAGRNEPGYGGTVILQGSGVATEFFGGVLPELDARGVRLNVLYVASTELFDALSAGRRASILPPALADEAMGITDFTRTTLYRFVTSERGRKASLHPFQKGRYLGSGRAEWVLRQAGLDARSQLDAILAYARGS